MQSLVKKFAFECFLNQLSLNMSHLKIFNMWRDGQKKRDGTDRKDTSIKVSLSSSKYMGVLALVVDVTV